MVVRARSTARIITLEAERPEGVRRFLSDRIELAEGRRTTVVDVTRTGKFYDPRYGEFEITREMLLSMVKNFDARVYGQDIALDVSHRPQDGAAGYFRKLFLEGNKLRGEIELTDYGVDAIANRGYKYTSAEYHENFTDNEHGCSHGPTLLGAGLTVRPVIKRLDPVQLSEDGLEQVPTLLSDKLRRILSEELSMNEWLKKLLEKLRAFKLGEPVIKQLAEAAGRSFRANGQAACESDRRWRYKGEDHPTAACEQRRKLCQRFPRSAQGVCLRLFDRFHAEISAYLSGRNVLVRVPRNGGVFACCRDRRATRGSVKDLATEILTVVVMREDC